jgi:hypothetical protein
VTLLRNAALPAQSHLGSQRGHAPHLLAVVDGAPNRASQVARPPVEGVRRLKRDGPIKRREWTGRLTGANMNKTHVFESGNEG